jgi:hypothetical protein
MIVSMSAYTQHLREQTKDSTISDQTQYYNKNKDEEKWCNRYTTVNITNKQKKKIEQPKLFS